MSNDVNSSTENLDVKKHNPKTRTSANYELIKIADQAAKCGTTYGKFVSKNKL